MKLSRFSFTTITGSGTFILGLALAFSWAGTVAPFEIISLLVITIGIIHTILYHRSWMLEKSHRILALLFAAYVLLQSAFAIGNITAGLITTYLVIAFLATEYAFEMSTPLRKLFVTGYMTGAVGSAVISIAAYIVRVTLEIYAMPLFFFKEGARLAGFFSDPVVYGAYLVPALVVLLIGTIRGHEARSRWSSAFAFLIVWANIILSGSRGAWISTLIACGITALYLLKENEWRIRAMRLTGLVMVSAVLAYILVFTITIPAHLPNAPKKPTNKTFYETTITVRAVVSDKPRFENWQSALTQLGQRSLSELLTGSGSGSLAANSPQKTDGHNTYLTLLYEQGVLGIALLILFFIAYIRELYHIYKKGNHIFVVALGAVLAGIAVQGLVVDIQHWRYFWMLLALL